MARKRLDLTFPPRQATKAITYHLVKDFDLEFNLLKATIYPRKEGLIVMELKGHPKNFRQGIKFLKDSGVKVQRVAHEVERNEEVCFQCGACTALCPTGALAVERPEMSVSFDASKCSACELCCVVCPARAMVVRINHQAL
jgi:ferredoxin